MSGNEQQIEYWNSDAGNRWAEYQERLDAAMAKIAYAVYQFAAAKPGERVLDIGCGCGTTSLGFARAVGKSGSVVGMDISRPMLEVARQRAAKAAANVTFLEADASDYPFKPEFDLLFSRFGVMFFADPAAAFTNLRKALRTGGRMRFVCWRAPAENLWATAPFAAVKDLLPPQEPMDPTAPGPFAFADGERLKGILRVAGFRNISLEKLETQMTMGVDVNEAVEQAFKIGPLARALAETEAVEAEVRTRVAEVLAKYKTVRGVSLPAACWLVGAEG